MKIITVVFVIVYLKTQRTSFLNDADTYYLFFATTYNETVMYSKLQFDRAMSKELAIPEINEMVKGKHINNN